MMKRVRYYSVISIAMCSAVGLVSGFLGAIHPVGDLMAPFRVPFIVTLLFSVFILPRWRLLTGGVILGILGVQLSGYVISDTSADPIPTGITALTVYQKNLYREPVNRDAMLENIRVKSPDILLLQEVSDANRFMLDDLQDLFPNRYECAHVSWDGNAILSKMPFVPGSVSCTPYSATAQIQSPTGKLWVVSLHLPWPWPFGQPEAVTALEQTLGQLEGPKIIGGDFNAVAWSHALSRISDMTGTRRLGAYQTTYWLSRFIPFGIGIDHILASPPLHGSIRRLRRYNSDHYGLLARLTLS